MFYKIIKDIKPTKKTVNNGPTNGLISCVRDNHRKARSKTDSFLYDICSFLFLRNFIPSIPHDMTKYAELCTFSTGLVPLSSLECLHFFIVSPNPSDVFIIETLKFIRECSKKDYNRFSLKNFTTKVCTREAIYESKTVLFFNHHDDCSYDKWINCCNSTL